MHDIIIIGAGSHSKVIYEELVNINNYNIIGFCNPLINASNKIKDFCKENKLKFYNSNSLKNLLKTEALFVLGLGNNYEREKVYKKCININKNIKWTKVISKNATISKSVKIGNGTVILSSVTIQAGTTIGKHCIINNSSSIDHDNSFKDFSSCAPGVLTGGSVSIGKNSFLGIGSTIINNIKIGNDTIIGANSLVLNDCKSNSIYYGSPVKLINKIDKNKKYF